MKIYEKICIDISSGQVIEESSYEYDGPIAFAKGGGGGGGSGAVDYPPYMKDVQADWLAGGEPTGIGLSTLSSGNDITSLIDSKIGDSPFATASAYDPADPINNMATALDAYNACSHGVAYLDAKTRLDDAINTTDNFDETNPYDDTISEITNYDNYLSTIETTAGIENELSNFSIGMSDINAVNSSSFTIGYQIIAGNLVEIKSKIYSDLVEKRKAVADGQIKKYTQIMNSANQIAQIASGQDGQRGQLEADMALKLMHYSIEKNRMTIAAKVEETNKNIKLDKNDALWDLEVFKMGGNILASIGGGTVSKGTDDEVSDGQAALGGAMSGAAMGASVTGGNPYGALIGGVIGGIGGLLM